MPLRSSLHLKINGVNGDATADAFDGSFPVDAYDITAPTSPSGIPQTFSFYAHGLKTSAAVSSDVASSDIASGDIVSSDIVSSAIASSAALSPASAAVPVPASSPLQYFLKIDGVTGDSRVNGFEGWFSVDGYDIGVQNTASLSAGGAGAGKAVFSPLTVDIHSLSGLSTLFGDVASGRHLKSVELAGAQTIKDQSVKVYDVKLSDVFVGSFENDPGPNGPEESLTFTYGQIQVTYQPQAKDSTQGTPQTFSFDLNELKTDAAVSSDIVSSDIASSAGLSAVSAAVLVPTSSPLHYFIKIDGVSGDSTVKGFEGWFSVDGYDIGVQNTASLSAGGAGAGKVVFSPLTVDIHSLTGLASLFGDVASGKHITSVELAGAQTIKDQSVKVYDVKLSNALVSSFENDPSSNGVETSLSFNYSKIILTDQPTTKNVVLGTPDTFSFDLNELRTDAAVSSDIVSSDIVSSELVSSAGLSPASAAVPASSPLQYFLKIDGVKGESTVNGFEGWFSVDGYDLGVQNTASVSAGGAGAGKAVFSPLTVDIHSLTGLASLFGDVASGKHITSVELAGAESIKDQSVKVYDVKLSNVLVSSFENDPSSNGVETSLSFNYSKITVTDQPTTKNVVLGTPDTFSFDVNELKTDAAVSSDIVSSDIVSSDLVSSAGLSPGSTAVPVPASSPLQYFVKIDGVTGDSTVKGFEGWSSVDGYDIGVQNTGSVSAGGAGAGKAVFSPLTVDIHSLSGLSTLFGDVASGRHLKSVELVGAENIEDQSVKLYDVKLSDVLVSSFENDPSSNGVETSLAFNYSKISLTVQPPSGHTIVGTPQTFSFDVNELKTDAPVSSDFTSQINQMATGLASFMASSQLGSSGSPDLVSTPSTPQDHQLPTLAAHA